MKSILLIIPYFGKWPLWFDAYLISIAKNTTINWLCVTDCDLPINYPENIKFIETTLPELNIKVNKIVNARVPLTPRKFCDLKPAYGDVFEEEIKKYDFWGICDMDIIWGDIRAFITNEILDGYDIISSRKDTISGHFSLFRNNHKINSLYNLVPNYKALFEQKRFMWFDEEVLTEFLKKNSNNINVYWPSILLNQEKGLDSHQEYHLDKWQWQAGKMIDLKTSNEVMYLHFINWKRTMKYCNINYNDYPNQFYISYNGLHYKLHSKLNHLQNDFKNIFNGYWVRMRRKKMKLYKKIFK